MPREHHPSSKAQLGWIRNNSGSKSDVLMQIPHTYFAYFFKITWRLFWIKCHHNKGRLQFVWVHRVCGSLFKATFPPVLVSEEWLWATLLCSCCPNQGSRPGGKPGGTSSRHMDTNVCRCTQCATFTVGVGRDHSAPHSHSVCHTSKPRSVCYVASDFMMPTRLFCHGARLYCHGARLLWHGDVLTR